MEKHSDRSGLPTHLRDGIIQALRRKPPQTWLVIYEGKKKVAELPLEDLEGMTRKDLDAFFWIQEQDGRTYDVEGRGER